MKKISLNSSSSTLES